MVNKFTYIHKHQETERDLVFLQHLILGGMRWGEQGKAGLFGGT